MKQSNEYCSAMDNLHYTTEQKERLARALASAQANSSHASHKKTYWRSVLVAAALIAVFTIGAGASGILPPPSQIFRRLMPLNEMQTQIVDKIGRPIDARATDNGLTISADAILGDRNHLCVVYSIAWDDANPLQLPPADENGFLPLGFKKNGTEYFSKGGSHGFSYFIDTDPSDNRILFVETISSNQDLDLHNGIIQVSLQDLFDVQNPDTPLRKGSWNFQFALNYEDSSLQLPSGQSFISSAGIPCTIQAVQLSPLALQIDFMADWDMASITADAPYESYSSTLKSLESVPLTITKTDGSVVATSNSGGGCSPSGSQTRVYRDCILPEVILLDEIQSITFGGIEIPVH